MNVIRARPPVSISSIPSLARHHSVSANELSHFSNLANSWWDPMGPSRVLHLMNPLRHDFIASCLSDSASASPSTAASTPGLDYLDIGCGGGIFAESVARTIPRSPSSQSRSKTQAKSVTALDPSDTLIRIARQHARTDPLLSRYIQEGRFRYLNRTVEEHEISSQNEAKNYDIITLFEVLEHIDPNTSNPLSFLTTCLRLLKPGGWLVGSTIARSLPSFIVNQVIAEAPWPVGVVPRGTHEWGKFVNPEEAREWAIRGLDAVRDGRGGGVSGREGEMWKCAGVMYFPGCGWKMVDGSEGWGNYFWGVRRGL